MYGPKGHVFLNLNGPFGLQLGPTQGEVARGGGSWGARDPPW